MTRVTKKSILESVLDMHNNLKFMGYVYKEVTNSRLFYHEYEAHKDFNLGYWSKKFLGSFEHPYTSYLKGDFGTEHKLDVLKERYEAACKLYEDMKVFFKDTVDGHVVDWKMAKERYEYRTGSKVTEVY